MNKTEYDRLTKEQMHHLSGCFDYKDRQLFDSGSYDALLERLRQKGKRLLRTARIALAIAISLLFSFGIIFDEPILVPLSTSCLLFFYFPAPYIAQLARTEKTMRTLKQMFAESAHDTSVVTEQPS